MCDIFCIALADLGGSEGGAQGRHWVLDPIDGTRGFVGQRQYAVCLGMLQEGEVVLGVLGCPNLPVGLVSDDDGKAGDRETTGSNHRKEKLLFLGKPIGP